MNDAVLTELLERVRGRYFGKYRGTVTEVDAQSMRIKAMVPNVLPGVASGWCMPCVPYAGNGVGVCILPEVGSGVWIEFEAGDVSYPIWVGCYWRSGEVPGSASATVKSIITTAGTLSFDTGAGKISLTDSNQHSVVLDSNGVTVTAQAGNVALGASGVNVNNGALVVS
jgi:uncharacterized protein involved in type VI secretion and phage assembly